MEQELAALRAARGLSQSARWRGCQPAIAKLESGTVKNPQLKTLVRMVTALGGRLQGGIVPPPWRTKGVVGRARIRSGRCVSEVGDELEGRDCGTRLAPSRPTLPS